MIPKQLNFDQEGREKLLRGIQTISRAVKSTLGPLGKTVLIESKDHTRGITITKDGVTVAKSISLDDPVEDLAVRVVREACEKTALSAGDGTTTSIVIAEALIQKGMEIIKENPDINVTALLRDLKTKSEEVITSLEKQAKKVSKRNLKHVATISANNDPGIGKLIADTYSKVGKDGVVMVENSETEKTYVDVIEGIRVDRGWSVRHFITNQENDSCEYTDALVLVSDIQIDHINDIQNVVESCWKTKKPLLIIGNISEQVKAVLAKNKIQNGLKVCHIPPPDFGRRSKELLGDIAHAVGATYFSEESGDNLELMVENDLGRVAKFVSTQDETIMVTTGAVDTDERVEQLKAQREKTSTKREKDFLSKRIASLAGGLGVIYVGGETDLEQKELYDRVEDAVCAVKAALDEGILPGGGTALLRQIYNFEQYGDSGYILIEGLISPYWQILNNAGITKVKKDTDDVNYGVNALTGEYVNMYEAGIIDPAKVTKNALRNAVSVACNILSTDCVVTMMRA